jgi:amino acid permease
LKYSFLSRADRTSNRPRSQIRLEPLDVFVTPITGVFLTSISTILGAILFLRLGYAVGHVGLVGVLFIIAVGHLVTIPTAMAIAEIATNQRVQGGGEYFIISRSFGVIVGAAIGISLYLSRAVSVAFYTIAFAEAFDPLFRFVQEHHGWLPADKRIISLPVTIGLAVLIWAKGASLGMKALYLVVAALALSLAMFFFGGAGYTPDPEVREGNDGGSTTENGRESQKTEPGDSDENN